jgi:hypothetical protein
MQQDYDMWYTSSQQSNTDQTESLYSYEDTATPKLPMSSIPKPITLEGKPSTRKLYRSPPQQEDQPPFVEDNSTNTTEFKLPPGIKLTGNKEADDDIIAFYKAKEILLSKASSIRR